MSLEFVSRSRARSNVLRMMLGQGLRLAVAGVALDCSARSLLPIAEGFVVWDQRERSVYVCSYRGVARPCRVARFLDTRATATNVDPLEALRTECPIGPIKKEEKTMTSLWQDLLYGVQMLVKHPAFTLVAD